MQPLPVPVAIHIGYRKTGSTWFQEVALPAHPRLASVPAYPIAAGADARRAVPFLYEIIVRPDREFVPATARDALVQAVRGVARDDTDLVVVSAERLSGHGASGGYDAVRIARRLHDVVPEARVFWFVREQASAIRAEYKQLVDEGWTGSVDATLRPRAEWRTVGFDLGHWEYDRLVEVYRGLYGDDAVRVLDYQRLRSEPRAVLEELAAFLGVEPWDLAGRDLGARRNVSSPDRRTAWHRRLNHLRVTEIHPFPPLTISERGIRRLASILGRLPAGALFPPDFDERMAAHFAASNARLAAATGVALGAPSPEVR